MEELFNDELIGDEFDGEIDQAFDQLRIVDTGYQPDGKSDTADQSQDEMPEPAFDKLSDEINFDYEILPPAAAAYVRDTSARLDCPPEFIAAPLITAFSALICSRIRIRPKITDKRLRVAPVVSGIAIAPSARTKSPKLSDALAPLYERDALERENFSAEIPKRGKSDRNRRKITLIAKYIRPSEAQMDIVSALLLSLITESKENSPVADANNAAAAGRDKFSNHEETNS